MTTPGSDGEAAEVVRRCLVGEPAAQRELIDQYKGLCYSISSRLLGEQLRSHVEDAVQEAFFAVFAKLSQWQGRNLAAWIGSIAARRSVDLKQRLARMGKSMASDASGLAPSEASEDHERELTELLEDIEALRRGMTDRQQQVLDGLLDGQPRAQMAEDLRVSLRTVQMEVKEIRRRLEELL